MPAPNQEWEWEKYHGKAAQLRLGRSSTHRDAPLLDRKGRMSDDR